MRLLQICANVKSRPVCQDRRDAERKRSEEHTSELQSQSNLVCRLLLEKKKATYISVCWAFIPAVIRKAQAGRYMWVSNIDSTSAGFISRTIRVPLLEASDNNRASADCH